MDNSPSRRESFFNTLSSFYSFVGRSSIFSNRALGDLIGCCHIGPLQQWVPRVDLGVDPCFEMITQRPKESVLPLFSRIAPLHRS